jgi:LPS sulfotransferase NodH
LLISFLNSHPSIRADGEVLNKLNGRHYTEILEKVFSRQPYYIAARGFKIFYYHPIDIESAELWHDLREAVDLRVIHLKRRNILRTMISRKIALSQEVWRIPSVRGQHPAGKMAVSFTPTELEQGFMETKRWEEEGDEAFQGHPMVSIDYEDLVDSTDATFRKITDLLDVRFVPPKTNLRKQNPERLRDLVTNYDELKSAFAASKWHVFFDE